MVEKKKSWSIGNLLPSFFGNNNKKPVKGPLAHSDASYMNPGGGKFLFSISYDGEKNLGEAGPIINYIVNHDLLRLRSWQSFLESEVTQTVIKRYITWMVGSGLKLQSEPRELVLKSENIKIDTQEFSELVEARFDCFKKSAVSDYSGMRNLNYLSRVAFKNALIGGDVLVVMRYDGNVNIQLIDGSLVQSPTYGTDLYPQKLENGNRITNGIEIDLTGRHVRYFVKDKDLKIIPIEARSAATGQITAFMVYGLEYRLGNTRGLPLIAAVIETLKKLERYKEAVLGSAEERAKIVYTIEHKSQSDGGNPLTKQFAKAQRFDDSDQDLPTTLDGIELARTVAASTNKQTFNLGIDQSLKSLDSKNDLYFKDFFSVNIDLICAALEMPPNVAMSKYDSNYSASRAALKDWENTLTIGRQDYADQFYQRVYNFWLYTEIMFKGKITAPGYLQASLSGNQIVLDAYQNARFVGPPVPHIDPWKEAKAVREMLGPAGANMPLTTQEAATEALGNGNSKENTKQFILEKEASKDLEPEPVIADAKNMPVDEILKRVDMMNKILESVSERLDLIDA